MDGAEFPHFIQSSALASHLAKCRLQLSVPHFSDTDNIETILKDSPELEESLCDFIIDHSPGCYTLLTKDHEYVYISRRVWEKSPVLMAQSPIGAPFRVDFHSRAVEDFLRLEATGVFPDQLEHLLELTALVWDLDVKPLLSICFQYHCRKPLVDHRAHLSYKLQEALASSLCAYNVMMNLVAFMSAGPLRTDQAYSVYFDRFLTGDISFKADDDATKMLARVVGSKLSSGLEPLHHSVTCQTAVAAIVDERADAFTTVWTENHFKRINIFNNTFDEFKKIVITDFFLAYDRYLIYVDEYRRLYFKNFHSLSPSVWLTNNVLKLLVRSHHCFVLSTEENSRRNRICKWKTNHFVPVSVGFAAIGSTVDYDPDTRFLCFCSVDADSFYIGELDDFAVKLVTHLNLAQIYSLNYYDRYLFVWAAEGDFVYTKDGRWSLPNRMVIGVDATTLDTKVLDGKLYAKYAQGWHVFSGERFRPPCRQIQFSALSEFSLNPFILVD